jgi:hypothetical protein
MWLVFAALLVSVVAGPIPQENIIADMGKLCLYVNDRMGHQDPQVPPMRRPRIACKNQEDRWVELEKRKFAIRNGSNQLILTLLEQQQLDFLSAHPEIDLETCVIVAKHVLTIDTTVELSEELCEGLIKNPVNVTEFCSQQLQPMKDYCSTLHGKAEGDLEVYGWRCSLKAKEIQTLCAGNVSYSITNGETGLSFLQGLIGFVYLYCIAAGMIVTLDIIDIASARFGLPWFKHHAS